jgi:hypothetical protein
MARGWESKSVEAQMEIAREESTTGARHLSSDDKSAARERQNLLLSRAYISQQIESSTNDKYTESLRKALEEVERKLGGLSAKG